MKKSTSKRKRLAGKAKVRMAEKRPEKGKKASVEQRLAAEEILLFPLISEKAVGMIEAENKLCFIVNRKATKADIRKAVEDSYSIKVDKVRVVNDRKGRKKAIVKINKKFKADEVATKLGVI